MDSRAPAEAGGGGVEDSYFLVVEFVALLVQNSGRVVIRAGSWASSLLLVSVLLANTNNRLSCVNRAGRFDNDKDFALPSGSAGGGASVAVLLNSPLMLPTRLPDNDWATAAMGLSGDWVSVRATIFSGGTPFVSTPIATTTRLYTTYSAHTTHIPIGALRGYYLVLIKAILVAATMIFCGCPFARNKGLDFTENSNTQSRHAYSASSP